MELEAAKMIGAGLAAIALAGAGVGIGIIFGNYLSGAMVSICVKNNSLTYCWDLLWLKQRIVWTCSSFNYFICILVN